VYASIFLDLERDGPVVIEVPPGAGPGTVNDGYFRFIIDMAGPGPDRGNGGKYIILPPDYDGEIEPTEGLETTSIDGEEYFVARSQSYKLNIPANVPAKNFWSVVVYDPQTLSELQTDQPYPSKNNVRDKLIRNADGSVDLYFGPEAPEGMEANWTQTVPGKGWFVLLRLYGPLDPWWEKTWRPGEFERIE
jgi:hypothetical protein